MFSKENPYVTIENLTSVDKQEIYLTNKELNLKFGLYDRKLNGYELDESIFTIKMVISKTIQNFDEKVYRTISPKIFRCENDPILQYCISDFDLSLKGYFNTEIFNFISISLNFCNNSTLNNSCKSSIEMQNFMQGKYFGFSYINHAFDFSNYENPLVSFPNFEYMGIDPKNKKRMSVFIKKIEFFDDSDPIFDNSKLKYETYAKDFDKIDSEEFSMENHSSIGNFLIFSNYNLQRTKRKYQKLMHIFAYLTGVFNFLKIMGMILIKFITDFKTKNYIMSFLYDFEDKCDKKKKRFDGKNKKFVLILKKILSLFRCFFSFFSKEKFKSGLFLFTNDNYHDEYLNVINIRTVFKGLQELQKMKIILFNQKELNLFNSIPRPCLNLKKRKRKEKNTKDVSHNIFNLIKVYRQSKNNGNREHEKITLNFHLSRNEIPNTIQERLIYFQKKINS